MLVPRFVAVLESGRASLRVLCFIVAGLAACAGGETPATGPRIALQVSPLTLPGVADACYDVYVRDLDAAALASGGAWSSSLVWSRAGLCSTAYGDARGDLSYVAPCDADGPGGVRTNSVELELVSLSDGVDPITEFVNPCPPGEHRCVLDVACRENQDTPVVFNLTVMRDANQGFFDIAVDFEDIFCSAKLDTCDPGPDGALGTSDDTPLALLFDGGERAATGVLAFACTAGADAQTQLFMTDVQLVCGATVIPLAPSAVSSSGVAGGNVPAPPGQQTIFGYAVYTGREQLRCGASSCGKSYWNMAIGFEVDAAGALVATSDVDGVTLTTAKDCHLVATATAADAAGAGMVGGGASGPWATPTATAYPVVQFDAIISDMAGTFQCVRHGLNDPGDTSAAVHTEYSPLTVAGSFCHRLDGVTGTVVGTPGCDPVDFAPSSECAVSSGCDGCIACSTTAVTCGLAPRVWYRADALGLADGDPVTLWGDAGAANQALAPNGTPPAFVATAIGGLPAVRFSGGGGMQSGAFSLQDGAQDFTLFMVLRAGNSQNSYADIVDNSHSATAGQAGPVVQQNGANTNSMVIAWKTAAGPYTISPPFSVGSAAFALHEDAKSGSNWTHSVDGTPVASATLEATMVSPDLALTFGSMTDNSGGRTWNGDLAEALYFNKTLTPAEEAAVTRYLADKYGLTVPAASGYANGGASCSCAPGYTYDDAGACVMPVDWTSCASIKATNPAATDGVYAISPDGGPAFDAYCDMTTDGGGWTLLATLHTTTTYPSGWPGWTDDWFVHQHGSPAVLGDDFSNQDFSRFTAIAEAGDAILRATNPNNGNNRYHHGIGAGDWGTWSGGRTVGSVSIIGPFADRGVTVSTSLTPTTTLAQVNGHWAGHQYLGLGTAPGAGIGDSEGIARRYQVGNTGGGFGRVGDVQADADWYLWLGR